jgi:tRNA G18 (ribose-2'-O)-methylase SpoU
VQLIGSSHPAVRQAMQLARNQVGDDENLTVAEGLWAHQAVLEASAPVPVFLWCPEALRGSEAAELAETLAGKAEQVYQISARTLQRLSERDKPDGLVSIVQLPVWHPDDVELGEQALVLVADGIEQPGNLGTLVRTLDACGADALLLTNTRTRRANTKVFKASHGTILRIPTVSFDRTADAVEWLDARDFQVYLADTDGAARYTDVAYQQRSALVMGNERYGITQDWYRDSAQKICIPMLGIADSLNVSISAAVLLYEVRSRLNSWRSDTEG